MPPKSDSEIRTNNKYKSLDTEADDGSTLESDFPNPFFLTNMANILQWNIHGLQANKEELDMLSSYIHPTIISVQETFVEENKIVTFKGYSTYHNYASQINGVVHGGSAILVNSSTPHRQLNLQTCLQAIVIRVTLRKTITYVLSTFRHLWLLIVTILMVFYLSFLLLYL